MEEKKMLTLTNGDVKTGTVPPPVSVTSYKIICEEEKSGYISGI